ncbi:DUF2164 domain-containing protein [Phenylobacterium sp. J367]|uniref:DUF2164 domain-containing protein n=1 Tax=Phenylobacterium sp. J367 TaxID=2898435 RepID=UPI0021511D06|nr:DUF2164 domain-containing protein [Phenylobacterium sp. J367]MCR5880271.1 DUF2164 domain-containing protein [Phenylobacterium sp. J367]
MARIELEKPVRDALTRALSRYLKDELDVEIGAMDALLLLDFITEKLGPHFYNQGLADAQAVLTKRVEDLTEAISAIEKPIRL